jgi:hypothetical protein
MAACMAYWEPRSDTPRRGDGCTPGVNGRHMGCGLRGSSLAMLRLSRNQDIGGR